MLLLFSVCLGDTACHVINVGTCHSNLPKQPWSSSSVVKCVLIVITKGPAFKSMQGQMFLHHIKIKLALVKSIRTICEVLLRLDQESIWMCGSV